MKGRVFNLYKEIGETPLERIDRFRKTYPEYANITLSFAGRLDPMAEGVLLVLAGAENKNREKYLHLPKTYMIDVIFGISTDTYDTLGIPVLDETISESVPKEAVAAIDNYIGIFTQKYPPYSSRTVEGKPLFEWAREGRLHEINIPEHDVCIYSIEIMSQNTISRDTLARLIKTRLEKINGDFRQKEIAAGWKKVLQSTPEFFPVLKLGISCESGTYMRSLADALGKDAETRACALSIMRTSVGKHNATDALAD